MDSEAIRWRNNNFKFAHYDVIGKVPILMVNSSKSTNESKKEIERGLRTTALEEKGEGERRRTESTVSSTPPTAGWQRLNDLPNNKSSRRYDRMQRGSSLGTSEPLTSPYLSAKASTYSIPFGASNPARLRRLPKHFEFSGKR